MTTASALDKIDLHLIRVLHTVLVERSVSRAALRLGMHQPAVSGALRRLRELAGDPILVRSGATMVPTEAALAMLEPARRILADAEALFAGNQPFVPQTARHTFRIAASDYLDPLFLPLLLAQVKAAAPLCELEFHALNPGTPYPQQLAQGEVDIVIGNWLEPPGDLHQARLLEDEVVCLVAHDHPAVRRGWDLEAWLAAEHIAPMPTHPGARGVIDEHLAARGLQRRIAARCAHFGLIPAMVAQSLLVLTTGRQYCARFTNSLTLHMLPCPVPFPRLVYYQLWHGRTQPSPAAQWLRDRVRQAAASLPKP